MPAGSVQLIVLGVVLLGGAAGGPLAFAAGGLPAFLAVYLVQLGAWIWAARVVWRSGARASVALILGFALAMRVAVMTAPPFLSSDVYRYIWDGKLVLYGINPFSFVPAAPELAHLRDASIYPRVNRPGSTHTIYPPLAQAAFAAAYSTGGDSVAGMRGVLLLGELVTALALLVLLRRWGLNPARVLLYAWCPLPLWEIGSSAHVDGLAVTAITLALLADARGQRFGSGLALAAGALTKLYPAALLPLFWPRGRARMLLTCVLASVLAFVPLLSVGRGIVGYLPWYLAEEGYGSGERFLFYRLLARLWPSAPPAGYYVLAAAAGAWVAGQATRRSAAAPRKLSVAAADVAGCLLLLATPHYPWYMLWLLPLLCVSPSAPWLYLVAAAPALYLGGLDAEVGERSLLAGTLVYGGTAVLVAWRALFGDRAQPG